MPSEFLGAGWQFPVSLADGEIALSGYEQNIRESIWTILGTAKGERLMRPDFGCGIHQLLFAPIGAGTAAQVTGEVRRALLQWEPRITLIDIQVESSGAGETLDIRISYNVNATNTRDNLVYPFYLERSVA